MKILHLFSNWKWTGPAEHALSLALALKQEGHTVAFACAAPPPDAPDSIAHRAGLAGIRPVTRFRLNKHFNPAQNLSDIPRLRRFIKKEKFDIVHTHLPNDHFLAGMALRATFGRTALIRTCYDGDGVRRGPRTRLLFSFMTDGLITISERTKKQIAERHYLSKTKLWKLDVPVDLKRFDPNRAPDNRAGFGLAPEAIIGGIVARVQRHRRFEVLLEAIRIILNDFPGFKFMIIGRGTHIEQIAVKPSQNMGIRTNLIFTGYKNEDFVETLACLNFKVFLMPGSDGSCRAVREAMALGIPVIAANRGMLSEIVEHGKEGLIIEDTPENLAAAMLYLVEHPEIRQTMGRNAYEKSRRHFNPDLHAKKVTALYEKTLKVKFSKKWYSLIKNRRYKK